MIEVKLYVSSQALPTGWRPYFPPVRFEGLPVGVMSFPIYCRNGIKQEGSCLRADANGVIVVDEPEIVECFLRAIADYPVFVPTTMSDRFVLNDAANARQIPHREFVNGVSFQSASDAVLAKMAIR